MIASSLLAECHCLVLYIERAQHSDGSVRIRHDDRMLLNDHLIHIVAGTLRKRKQIVSFTVKLLKVQGKTNKNM